MSKFTFAEDFASRKVTRYLLGLQIAALVIVICLSLFELFIPALFVSIFTLIAFAAAVVWLYARFRSLPHVREKHEITHLSRRFRKSHQVQMNVIEAAIQERERLLQAEQDEIEAALTDLQQEHIEAGLAAASIEGAPLPGVGPILKERLMAAGVVNAAQVDEQIARISGFGDAKRQALLDWRKAILARLESTKPTHLPERQVQRIARKYQALQEKNGVTESRARASKEILEHELLLFAPRLRQLAPLTFPTYFSQALASQGFAAGLLAAALIFLQAFSTVSTARSAVMAVLPEWGETGTSSHLSALVPPAEAPLALPPVPPEPSAIPETKTAAQAPSASDTPPPQAALPAGVAACLPQNALLQTALVVGVVDGDTIDVRMDGQDWRVRYIGVNTPEQDQPLYQQALAFNRELVLDQTVTLIRDTSETDEYDRLLRYVLVGDTFVNQKLVEAGFAEAAAYAPDTACIEAFESAQRQAQTSMVGVWLAEPSALLAPVTGGETATAAAVAAACDPSYPGVCIPSAPPDLDCGDIPFRRFQVIAPDPHGFDRDSDGVGCE